MSVRNDLTSALAGLLPDTWRLVGYADLPDALTRPTACLWQDTFTRLDGFTDSYSVDIQIWILTKFQGVQKAEDDLDDLLEEFLPALHQVPFIEFDSAQRGVLDMAFHGYNITAHIPRITIGA